MAKIHITFRIESIYKAQLNELKEKFGVKPNLLVQEAISQKILDFEKNPKKRKRAKVLKMHERSQEENYYIKAQCSKAAFMKNALTLIKEIIAKAAYKKDILDLIEFFEHKSIHAYNDRRYASVFKRLKKYFSDDKVFGTYRILARQNSQDKMVFLVDSTFKKFGVDDDLYGKRKL